MTVKLISEPAFLRMLIASSCVTDVRKMSLTRILKRKKWIALFHYEVVWEERKVGKLTGLKLIPFSNVNKSRSTFIAFEALLDNGG